ncbi:MAG TPA: EI24 domain-containing protein, partial [Gemmataceae bacterium]|nr:EI24 domain-containing protein [Gemmataceae bacterium]
MPSPVNDRGRESIGALGGLRAFYGGIGFVLSTPSVWGWSLVPVGFMALLSLGLCGLSWWGAWEASKGLVGGENLGTWTLTVLFALLGAMLAVLIALTLAQPCSSFALEAICRAQERAMVGRASPAISYWASLGRNLKVIVVTLVLGSGTMVALFVIEVLVPPAAVVTVPLKFLIGGWLMAWNFLRSGFGGWVCVTALAGSSDISAPSRSSEWPGGRCFSFPEPCCSCCQWESPALRTWSWRRTGGPGVVERSLCSGSRQTSVGTPKRKSGATQTCALQRPASVCFLVRT